MPESPNPGQSYEAWIESKAGACPPEPLVLKCDGTAFCPASVHIHGCYADWPMPSPPPFPADDEDDEAPDE